MLKLALCFYCIVLFFLPLRAQDIEIPRFFSDNERILRPDLSRLVRLRFLTTFDFPPFNYRDSNDNLAGYHIDLARNICRELELMAKCQIEATTWEKLLVPTQDSATEVIIAGLAATRNTRNDFWFSRPYMHFPARFVGLTGEDNASALTTLMAHSKIGIVKNTVHEKMFAAYFPLSEIELFEDYAKIEQALLGGKLQLAFGDGLHFALWLGGQNSNNCCHFVGSAYYNTDYLGQGLRLAVASNDKTQNKFLIDALDFALKSLEQRGILKELYLRYFPIGFY